MNRWLFIPAILFLAMIAVAQTAQIPQSVSTVQSTQTYLNSKDGFRSQVDAILKSYRAGDVTAGHQLIDQFRLPNSEEWFSETLASGPSAKLTERYDRLFTNFSEDLEKTIEGVVANRESDLVTDLEGDKGETPSNISQGRKLSGVTSVKDPHLSYGHFALTVKKGNSVSWADIFAYQDGAFRFIGFGAWPFWVWEEGSEGAAPKGGSFMQPAILISQVSPVYPASAKASRIEGVVIIHILIDKEGHVKKADVLQGNPLLTQAALDAVQQWHYKPSTLGGAPAEDVATVTVTFALR